MQTISPELETELNDGSQTVVPKVVATWADSKYMDNLSVISSSEQVSAQILSHSPLVYARFEETGGATAFDSSPNARDGIYQGTTTYAQAGALAGESSLAISHTTTGYVQWTEATHGSVFSLVPQDFTVMAFVKMLADGSARYVAAKAASTTGGSIEWFLRKASSTDKFQFAVYNTTGSAILTTGSTVVDPDKWYLVAGVKEGNQIRLLVDGVVEDTKTVTGTPNTTAGDMVVHRLSSTSTTGGAGRLIDEFAVFGTALTTEQIKAIYDASVLPSTNPAHSNFKSLQALNGKQRSSMKWAVTDAIAATGETITTDAGYRAIDDINDTNHEYGWWSRSLSDSTGYFLRPEYVIGRFDVRKANFIELYTSEHYGRIKTYSLSYYNAVGTEVPVVTNATFPKEQFIVEHALPGMVDITGVKVSVQETHEGNQPARVQEINPILKTDVSSDIVDISVEKQRENYDTTVPFGITAANFCSLTLDNTDKEYNVFGAGLLAPYIRKDVKFDVYYGWRSGDSPYPGSTTFPSTDLYPGYEEYVKQGTFYVDDWQVSSDAMTIVANARDASKYLQEDPMELGFMYENETAARAIVDLARINGIPYDRIHYRDTHTNTIVSYLPIAYWKMGENPGDTVMKDHLERMTGTYENGPSLGAVSLITDPTDTSVFFNGSTHYGIATASAELNACTTLTWGGWIKSQDIAKDQIFLGQQGANYIRIVNSKVYASFYINGVQTTFSGGPTLLSNTTYHIMTSYDGYYIRIYVNGSLVATSDYIPGFLNMDAATVVIGGYRPTDTVYDFAGWIDEVVIYSHALKDQDVVEIYESGFSDVHYVYPFIYGKDETAWDAMLNIATADIGMFYFDENDVMQYESGTHFHQSIPTHTQHTDVQYELDDSTNIISGEHVIELQTNKVIVKINSKSTLSYGIQSIWRADDNASLVVTGLAGAHDRKVTTINVDTTDEPLWPSSGSFKIDDEIITYTGKTYSSFTGCTRGAHGTSPASHSAGAKVREHRIFDIEYSSSPAFSIQQPHITATLFEDTVDIEEFKFDSFKATLRVSAALINPIGSTVWLEGTDPVTELNYYTAIAGRPLSEKATEQVIKQEEKTSDTVRRYGYKKLEIDNKFIQTKERAEQVAQFILDHFKMPVPIIEVSTMGIPHLQLGDRVRITSFDQLDISNKDYWIMAVTSSYNGGIDQRMILREVS